jgi:RNA polymerase primary sigma factor
MRAEPAGGHEDGNRDPSIRRKVGEQAVARRVAGGRQLGVNLMGYIDRSSAVSRYFSEIRQFPILSEKEERELTASLVGKDRAKAVNKLVESNLPFVVKIASEFRNPAVPFEDLLNEGNVGLIEAARRFDHSRGARFISYAAWWIRKSILLALSRQSNTVRIPSYQMEKARQVRVTERALARELGRKPDREEISKELQSTIGRIDKVLQVKRNTLSLDAKIGRDKGTPISDCLVDRGAVNPEEKLLREESQDLIRLALKDLSDQERTVIISRFGLEGRKTLTLREVGERLGITAERVRQIEVQAGKRLRKLISRNLAITTTSKHLPGGPPCPA